MIRVRGTSLDVVQQPLLSVWLETSEGATVKLQSQDPTPRSGCKAPAAAPQACIKLERGWLQVSL